MFGNVIRNQPNSTECDFPLYFPYFGEITGYNIFASIWEKFAWNRYKKLYHVMSMMIWIANNCTTKCSIFFVQIKRIWVKKLCENERCFVGDLSHNPTQALFTTRKSSCVNARDTDRHVANLWGGGIYLGWGVPTLARRCLPWLGVPTLTGDYLPWPGVPPPSMWTDWKHYLPPSFGCGW